MNTKVDYEEAKEIGAQWGYHKFTALQDMVLKDCDCMENAREFIIGSTSSGKTLIPLICVRADQRRCEKKVKLLYMVPYRALATQKAKEFVQKFTQERVIVSTSEYCSEDANVMNGNCDIAIVIYEKIFMFLSNDKRFLDQYTHIVFDELGIVENPERGLKVDFILYRACRFTKSNIYVLATPYFNWNYYISLYSFHRHQEESRPVQIKNTIINYTKGEVGHEYDEQDGLLFDLCDKHRRLGHKILIFANSRARVRDISKKLYLHFGGSDTINAGEAKRQFLSRLVMTEDDLYGIMDRDDYLAYAAGITYHNASLPEEVRELIEGDFLNDDGCIDIVAATETLAYGLNSNVDMVIVTEMEKPIGRGEKKFLTVNEYENYIGRAGRLGKKTMGYTYTFVEQAQDTRWEELKEKIKDPDVMESQYKGIWETEECIFHLLNYFDDPHGIQLSQVSEALGSFPYSHEGEAIDLEPSVRELRSRRLIRENYDELDDSVKIKVSKTGRRALGFIVSMDTYDRLNRERNRLFHAGTICIFDFLYAVCHCKELHISDYYPIRDSKNYRSHLIEWLGHLEEKGDVSGLCRKSITTNPMITKFKNEKNRFSQRDFAELRKVRMAEAIYMWIECYSVEEIEKRCGFSYGIIKKMGEKAKYITDILSAEISMTKDVGDLEIILKQTGLSLYYGVKRELIQTLNLLELEPVEGRQLRTIGRIKNIKEHYSKAKAGRLEMLMAQIASFPDEYKGLAEGD